MAATAGIAGLAGLPVEAEGTASAAAATSRSRRVPFGAAIQTEFFEERDYRRAFLDHCDMIVPANELKFGLIHPQPEEWLFERADRLVDFAAENGRKSRGHTHVWWGETPAWIEPLSTREAEAALIEHIETVTDRYKGRLTGWDVVNEVIANDPIYSGYALRRTTWLEKLGPRHIPLAFRATANADPDAELVINDYDLEFRGPVFDKRREIMLSIVRQMQDENIEVTGVGIQGHLYTEREIDKDALEEFHRTLDGMGVDLLVTELDVIDRYGGSSNAEQDAAASKIVGDLLDGVFAFKPPRAVITWGLTDRYSWIPDVMPRDDGVPQRPLPLDRDYEPKNWMDLIQQRVS